MVQKPSWLHGIGLMTTASVPDSQGLGVFQFSQLEPNTARQHPPPQGKSPHENNSKSFQTYSLFQNTTEGQFPTQLKAVALAAEHSKVRLWLNAGFGDWERCMRIMYWTEL